MAIGEFIRSHRQARELTLRDLARRVNVDAAYLSRVEGGKAPPSDHLLLDLADALSLSADELLLVAGRLPEKIRALVEKEPYRVSTALRSLAEMSSAEPGRPYGAPLVAVQGTRAIEDGFPFEAISEIAEIESWRKEVYRPIYHVHKWWAHRLGSVFRAAILGAASPQKASVTDLFYEPVQLPGLVVFDPFMGSGTTVGEAHKLGCTAIGRDINPVAYRAVRTGLGPVRRDELLRLFEKLQTTVGEHLRDMYRSVDSDGNPCDVLYFFWVMLADCPKCRRSVDLFSSYQFARHAYVKKHPLVQTVCPSCGGIFQSHYQDEETTCPSCRTSFDPRSGPANRSKATCRTCHEEFPIAKTVKKTGRPPKYRMYAKLVLREDGSKQYLPATDADLRAYEHARHRLAHVRPALPEVQVESGYNTNQIINYGFKRWQELFNDRQLLALSSLAAAIRDLPPGPGREALASLFSGVLEFNNMFVSFKGEGTGAVRHMFSHHILKPERTPIEANVWGTHRSSGAFSTLFKSRLLRALDYREAPFEVAVDYSGKKKKGSKVFGTCPPLGGRVFDAYPDGGLPPGSIYLSCGSSTATDLPDESVDAVVTDPPFFDNVHYSELADFFFVWQELYFNGNNTPTASTRNQEEEVQDRDAASFAEKLRRVFVECNRVLKPQGLLVFSYHHSREEGWSAVAKAVCGAGFSFVQAQPVKAEMSVAAPKAQAKEPIDLDVLVVCRKQASDRRPRREVDQAAQEAVCKATSKVARFNDHGRRLSRNDVQVVVLSQALVELSAGRNTEDLEGGLEAVYPRLRDHVDEISGAQQIGEKKPDALIPAHDQPVQMGLLDQLS
jgi:putative DNA methylase